MKKSVILLICWLLVSGGFMFNAFSSTGNSTDAQDEYVFSGNQTSVEMMLARAGSHDGGHDGGRHPDYHRNSRPIITACIPIFLYTRGD